MNTYESSHQNRIAALLLGGVVPFLLGATKLPPSPSSTETAIIIQTLDNKPKTLFAKNKNRPLAPASLTKLVTSFAMLKKFGAQHQFETKFFSNAAIEKGSIHHLYIESGMDPYLTDEDLYKVAIALKNMGITSIKGDIILIEGKIANDHPFSRRPVKQSNNAYDAPLSALPINFNTIGLKVFRQNSQILVRPFPFELPNLEVIYKVEDSAAKTNLSAFRVTDKEKTRVHVQGHLSKSEDSRFVYRSISRAPELGLEILAQTLQNAGIDFTGSVKEGPPPPDPHHIFTHKGKDISSMVTALNRYSNNFIADSMVYLASDQLGKGPLSFKKGLNEIKDSLKSISSCDDKHIQIHDGSGLDPSNRITADCIADLLHRLYHDPTVFPEFFASLPASSQQGSLKERFSKLNLDSGWVRAKTGTLTQPISVSAIAGYTFHPQYNWLSFVIIQNGRSKTKAQPSVVALRDWQDHFLTTVLNSNKDAH